MRRPPFLFPGESCPAGAPAGGLLPRLHGGQALRLQHGHILPVPEPFPFQRQQVGAVVAEKAPGTGSAPCPSGAFFRAGSYKTVRFFRKFLTCSGNLRNRRMVLRCGQTNLHKSGGALCTGCTKVFFHS